MKTVTGITVGAMLAVGAVGGGLMALNAGGSVAGSSDNSELMAKTSREIAQVPAEVSPFASDAEADDSAPVETETSGPVSRELAEKAPESTEVSGHLVNSDGSPVGGGVVYFVFQNRLNEVPHTDPLQKIVNMAEAAAAVDEEGTFTLKMKPGNFTMVYDPLAVDVPEGPGPESMEMTRRQSREQVQARIAAIKENAMQGLPISNGKIGDAFVVENRFIRPPVSNFGDIKLQDKAVVTIRAVDEAGEPIDFPATLRLRGKNGDIMEPHTPSVSKRAIYEFYDLIPQSYQVFAIGTLPRPGAGDEISTPTLTNDQFIFTGDALSQDVVVKQSAE